MRSLACLMLLVLLTGCVSTGPKLDGLTIPKPVYSDK